MVTEKFCSQCEEVKPASAFYQNKRRRDGLGTYCKKCESEYTKRRIDKKRITTRAWSQRNREKINEHFRERYATDEEFRKRVNGHNQRSYYSHHEETLARRQDYRESHREEYRAKMRDYIKRPNVIMKRRYYREQNKEQAKERIKEWHKRNPGKKLLYWSKRRAQKNGQNITGEPIDRAEIIKRDNATCYICGRGPLPDSETHLDHVIPLNKGGSHTPDNIRVACRFCNCKKQDKDLAEVWRLIEAGLW